MNVIQDPNFEEDDKVILKEPNYILRFGLVVLVVIVFSVFYGLWKNNFLPGGSDGSIQQKNIQNYNQQILENQ